MEGSVFLKCENIIAFCIQNIKFEASDELLDCNHFVICLLLGLWC